MTSDEKELNVLLDGSTIVESLLALRSGYFMEALGTLVEALVLYDNLFYDPTIDWKGIRFVRGRQFNIGKKSSDRLDDFLKPCPLKREIEQSIMQKVASIALSYLRTWDVVPDERRIVTRLNDGEWGHSESKMKELANVLLSRGNQKSRIRSRLTCLVGEENVKHMLLLPHPHLIGYDIFISKMEQKIEAIAPDLEEELLTSINSEAYQATFLPHLRTAYYDLLSRQNNLHYCPHPERVELLENLRSGDSNALMLDCPRGSIPKKILEYLEREVREKVLRDVAKVFQQPILEARLPPVYEFIESRISDVNQIVDFALSMRDSDEARAYRSFCRKIETDLREGKLDRVSRSAKEIESIAEELASSLGGQVKKRKIGISIGIFSTEVDVPDPDLRIGRSKRHLVFLHQILNRWQTDHRNNLWNH